MFGDLMIEENYRHTGFRVLQHEAEGTRVEISWAGEWKGSGPLAGVEGTDRGTVTGILRTDGVANPLQGNGVFITKDGQILSYSSHGISLPEGSDRRRARYLYLFRATSPKYEWLKTTCLIWEDTDDLTRQEGHSKGYQWK